MKLKILFAIFSLLFPMSVVHSQSTGTDEVIQRLKEVRERTKDFSADLLQEKTISSLKRKMVSQGHIRYKFPDKFCIEFFQPEPSLILFDGKTFLTYLKEGLDGNRNGDCRKEWRHNPSSVLKHQAKRRPYGFGF